MKLGAQFGYWTSGPPADLVATAKAAERLGYDSVWAAESYSSDVFHDRVYKTLTWIREDGEWRIADERAVGPAP